MRLPFTIDQFLDVFRHYNLAVWPAQWVLAALAAAAVVLALRDRPRDRRWVSGILALLWLWVALAYHVAFFAGVNPVAVAFAAAFVAEAFLFAWLALREASPSYRPRSFVTTLTGAIVVAYALVGYPALGYLLGHRYPVAPTFGVPCPTTIFTLGVLVWASGSVPRRLLVVPLAWAVVATSAAVQLGMTEDFGLPIAGGAALVVALLTRERHHQPNAASPRSPMHIIPSIDDLSAVWRLLVLRAGIVLVLSIAALPWPVASLAVIVVLVSIIAVVAALFDAALSGALQLRTAGGWALLPEALIGVALGGAVLLYPLVPLGAVALLLSLWILARGVLLLTVVRRTASDGVLRTLAMGWAAASVLVPVAILAEWSEANILYVLAVLLTYVLIWSALELAVGLHLRSRARRPVAA